MNLSLAMLFEHTFEDIPPNSVEPCHPIAAGEAKLLLIIFTVKPEKKKNSDITSFTLHLSFKLSPCEQLRYWAASKGCRTGDGL